MNTLICSCIFQFYHLASVLRGIQTCVEKLGNSFETCLEISFCIYVRSYVRCTLKAVASMAI